ncbi:MAG TPA: undecaprenyldiphospho-muramoylpentapeptide beta-N-acetylglucosaminyltransferase [Patescibacteria group bacterium]|nr:undecaprenyldiphospho-muramoylpentapeptide beta-N-acetylglucosaminyltransferase [Patescibacteria group bacterium]
MPEPKTIVLAAGGTGGHLFPAEALALELVNRGHKVVILTDKRGVAFKSLGTTVEIHTVKAATLKPGIVAKAMAVADMGIGILQAFQLLKKYKPAIVVGFGGYPSFPGVFAAQMLKVPTILHEQNAVLGKANVWLADKAVQIATSLPGTQGIKPANQNKVAVTGNPVRASIIAVRENPYEAPSGELRLFITGGSQAAKVFAEVIPDAVQKLPHELQKRLFVVHQVREDSMAETERKYRMAGIRSEIKSFFGDMPERLKSCHLFIGRAGASTVAEIATVGRPAIFVPYPGHADMQQKYNAEVIAGRGGAWVMLQDNFTAESLAVRLQEFMNNPQTLEIAAAAAKSCGQPEAARNLADLVENKINS